MRVYIRIALLYMAFIGMALFGIAFVTLIVLCIISAIKRRKRERM